MFRLLARATFGCNAFDIFATSFYTWRHHDTGLTFTVVSCQSLSTATRCTCAGVTHVAIYTRPAILAWVAGTLIVCCKVWNIGMYDKVKKLYVKPSTI